MTADKVEWRLLTLSTSSSVTPDRGPLHRPGGGVLRSGEDVTLGTGLQWSGARQTPFRRWCGFLRTRLVLRVGCQQLSTLGVMGSTRP